MTKPTWLWAFYLPNPTRQQINSNFVRMHQSNPTPQEMADWKELFIEKVEMCKEDQEYLRGLTYEKLQKQWAIKKPENHYSNRTKKKKCQYMS